MAEDGWMDVRLSTREEVGWKKSEELMHLLITWLWLHRSEGFMGCKDETLQTAVFTLM